MFGAESFEFESKSAAEYARADGALTRAGDRQDGDRPLAPPESPRIGLPQTMYRNEPAWG